MVSLAVASSVTSRLLRASDMGGSNTVTILSKKRFDVCTLIFRQVEEYALLSNDDDRIRKWCAESVECSVMLLPRDQPFANGSTA